MEAEEVGEGLRRSGEEKCGDEVGFQEVGSKLKLGMPS